MAGEMGVIQKRKFEEAEKQRLLGEIRCDDRTDFEEALKNAIEGVESNHTRTKLRNMLTTHHVFSVEKFLLITKDHDIGITRHAGTWQVIFDIQAAFRESLGLPMIDDFDLMKVNLKFDPPIRALLKTIRPIKRRTQIINALADCYKKPFTVEAFLALNPAKPIPRIGEVAWDYIKQFQEILKTQ